MQEENKKETIMLTIPQAVEKTGLSKWFIRNLVNEGIVYSIKAGRKTYINNESLMNYLRGTTGERITYKVEGEENDKEYRA